MTTTTTNTTPAERVWDCLEETLLGGWTVRSECGDEFEKIPCGRKESNEAVGVDFRTYDNGEGDDLVLVMNWGDEEFYIV